MSTLDWDARTYERVSSPQLAWGAEVVGRLALRGDEAVLDAGCGTGRVTELLLERLPRGRVVGVDASPSMIEQARERLGARAELRVADLLELDLPEPVDVVVSTATFHWIGDHATLFARLLAALRPGGRLVAQYGGRGNVAPVVEAMEALAAEAPFAAHLRPWRPYWRFPSAEEARADLEGAGFDGIEAWLERKDARPPDIRGFLASSVVPRELDRLPESLRASYLDALEDRLGHPDALPYVRVNVEARRP